MAENPSYVRLSTALSRGMRWDRVSGWAISGRDVQKFPKDARAAKFVQREINAGRIEAASRAEHEDAHAADGALDGLDPEVGHQEHLVRDAAAEAVQRMDERASEVPSYEEAANEAAEEEAKKDKKKK